MRGPVAFLSSLDKSAAQLLIIYSSDSSINLELILREGVNSILGQMKVATLMGPLVPHVSCLCVLVPILSCPHFPLCLCLSLCLFILSKSITIVSIHDFTFTLPLDPEADSGHKAEGLELPCRKYYNLSSGAFLFSVKIGLSSTLP